VFEESPDIVAIILNVPLIPPDKSASELVEKLNNAADEDSSSQEYGSGGEERGNFDF
jgi:hypothetical protein